MRRTKTQSLISTIYSDPKYAGHHVIIIGGKIYATKSGLRHAKLLEKLIKKYPGKTPTISYIPKADTLILILN